MTDRLSVIHVLDKVRGGEERRGKGRGVRGGRGEGEGSSRGAGERMEGRGRRGGGGGEEEEGRGRRGGGGGEGRGEGGEGRGGEGREGGMQTMALFATHKPSTLRWGPQRRQVSEHKPTYLRHLQALATMK